MTYGSYFSYRRHASKKHSALLEGPNQRASTSRSSSDVQTEADAEEEVAACIREDGNDSETSQQSVTNVQESAAADMTDRLSLMLLKWKEGMKLPETAVNEIANDLISYLQEFAQEASDTPDGQSPVDIIKKLPALQTKHSREEYWKTTLAFVKPTAICLGKKPNGNTVTFQYISVLKVLKHYLESSGISYSCGLRSKDDHLATVFDGTVFKNHRFFRGDLSKLCIQLYTDEFEVCDPLGAKRGKHKLLVVYYTLINVPSEYRSLLEHIHLALIVKEKVAQEYGLHRIFEPLVSDIAVLETEGVLVNNTRYTGSVLCMVGDNLSSHHAGGFSTNFSHGRVCRFCMALHHELSLKHCEKDFVMRSPEGHKYHLSMLKSGLPAQSLYGVKAPCALTLENFEPTEHLPPDVMHDVHEGVIPFLLKHVLANLISEGYFSLDMLNNCIENFPYDPCDTKNKPEAIARSALFGKSALKGSASQKFCLFRHIALYVGEHVPPENRVWMLYILFREIVNLIMCNDIPASHVPYLYRRITFFREEFESLFPHIKIPCKMHYILHYPTFIYKYGPLVSLWCMSTSAPAFSDVHMDTAVFC
ncbi:uncharacterized protein LOC135371463 [Ornithodoros turicata]|uniref:uncharacterized protein LOC135371463 n=1 Tax=Ornithodoros turicata TaxID=34597 RepID=UPI00313A2AB8